MLLIVNPCAGKKKITHHIDDIIAIFNQAGYAPDLHYTTCQGDATRIVKTHGADADVIVCCGGDGTFNETVSGILSEKLTIPVGYIPAGSTNDFASSLNLHTNFTEAAKQIAYGTPTPIDIGLFNNRFFSYIASFGAFTKASYDTPQNMKNVLGHSAYLLSGAMELSHLKKYAIKLELDGESLEGSFLFGAICNCTSIGGILKFDHSLVDMADGKFEVMLVRTPHSVSELAECIRAVNLRNYQCRAITFRHASHIKITAPPDMDWTLDGEHEKGHEQIEIVNQNHAIFLLK